MTYLVQSKITADRIIVSRVAACAEGEGIPDPRFWAQENVIRMAGLDGWVSAYRSSSDEEPGADESAITDEMILAAVRAVFTAGRQRAAEPQGDQEPEV